MQLLDFSQTCLANTHQQLKISGDLDPDQLRQMILNSIRKLNRQFRKEYGQMVLCTDSHHCWRKTYFQFYKASRTKDPKIDWDLVFSTINTLREEIRLTFPYKVITVLMAEADDIIAVLARHYRNVEPILVISSDKDFTQLLAPNISIYRPFQDELLSFEAPVQLPDDLCPFLDLVPA